MRCPGTVCSSPASVLIGREESPNGSGRDFRIDVPPPNITCTSNMGSVQNGEGGFADVKLRPCDVRGQRSNWLDTTERQQERK